MLAIPGLLMKELGFLDDSTAYLQILAGTYTLPLDVDQCTKELLKDLKYQDHLTYTLKVILTTDMFHKGWSKIKERTLSGLLGMYFSYVKVCTKLNHLSEFKVTIEYIPFTTRYSPSD